MAERASWRTRWILAVSLVCLAAAAYSELGSRGVATLRSLTGYAHHVRSLIDAGETEAALAALDAATPFDEEALALLERMPAVGTLTRARLRDARLRTQIAQQFADRSGKHRTLDAEDRRRLELATGNAERLVALDPSFARSHLRLGLLYLRLGVADDAPINYMRAVQHLQRALQLDPAIEGAADPLRVALARSRR